MNETQRIAKKLFMSNDNEECHWESMPEFIYNNWILTAKHVQRMIIQALIEETIRIYPDLNSEGGITIQQGSSKHEALKRKVELEKELWALK